MIKNRPEVTLCGLRSSFQKLRIVVGNIGPTWPAGRVGSGRARARAENLNSTSDQPFLDLSRAQESFMRRQNSNIAIEPPTKLLALAASHLRFRPLK